MNPDRPGVALPDVDGPIAGGTGTETSGNGLGLPDLGDLLGTAPEAPSVVDGAFGPIRLALPQQGMSNALLVSGEHTATGRPVTVFGPQTGYYTPQMLTEEVLVGPGVKARGVAFAGTNLVVQLGHGVDYAWSATSASNDNVDTVVERLCDRDGSRPTVRSTSYVRGGRCVPMDHHTHTEKVIPNITAPELPATYTFDVWRTRHGIVQLRTTVRGRPVAIVTQRSTYGREVSSVLGFSRFNNPRIVHDAASFQRAAGALDYTFNWFYADNRDIAYFSSGRLPRRAAGTDFDLPRWGSRRYDWQGWLPWDEHPRQVNPARGYLASWNNKPAPGWGAPDEIWGWGSVQRSLAPVGPDRSGHSARRAGDAGAVGRAGRGRRHGRQPSPLHAAVAAAGARQPSTRRHRIVMEQRRLVRLCQQGPAPGARATGSRAVPARTVRRGPARRLSGDPARLPTRRRRAGAGGARRQPSAGSDVRQDDRRDPVDDGRDGGRSARRLAESTYVPAGGVVRPASPAVVLGNLEGSMVLVAERIGEFDYEGHRLEYTEYGSGDSVVVLLHGQLMPRRMHEPLARAVAGEGYHVYTLDLLGHGRSDKPTDPGLYSMTAFGRQVVAFLDHHGVEQAVVGGTSLGANTTLEVAARSPERLRGMIIEMPVLDNAVEAGIIAFAPLLFVARAAPIVVKAVGRLAQAVPRSLVPFWSGIALDTMSQEPHAMAATIHGIFYGRVAPPHDERIAIDVPALVVGHPRDPIHPAADAAMLADELVSCRFVEAESFLEWRRRPDRLNAEALDFVQACWVADDLSAVADA